MGVLRAYGMAGECFGEEKESMRYVFILIQQTSTCTFLKQPTITTDASLINFSPGVSDRDMAAECSAHVGFACGGDLEGFRLPLTFHPLVWRRALRGETRV